MPFQRACFISYRSPQLVSGPNAVHAIVDCLKEEIGSLVDEEVSFDQDRLKPGYLLDESLALELYRSTCMVVIYTPHYFSLEKRYCAREYFAMLKLEKERRALLPESHRNLGFIIPVAYRGQAQMLKDISAAEAAWNGTAGASAVRRCENFEKFRGKIDAKPGAHFRERIGAIAEEVHERCRLFRDLYHTQRKDPFTNANGFSLPLEDEVQPWLMKTFGYDAALPTREAA